MGWCRRQFLRCGLPCGAALLLVAASFAEKLEEAKRLFKLPEGRAARTLKLAARQGGVDIVFAADVVKGVKTQAIKGEYAPSEAFRLMLQGSLLIAVRHEKSGVYLIEKRKRPVAENG